MIDTMTDTKFRWISMPTSFQAWDLRFIPLPISWFAMPKETTLNKTMNFDEYLVPYNWNSDWIESKLDAMVALMNQHEIPEPNECCKNCAYSEQYAKAVHPEGNGERKPVQRRLFF